MTRLSQGLIERDLSHFVILFLVVIHIQKLIFLCWKALGLLKRKKTYW